MTKSYVLAQKLSQSEWKRFVREVKKGILSQHRDTQRYVISLDPHYPNFDVEDTALHHAVYPLRSFSGERMRVLRTYFYQLLEDFLLKNLLNENQLLREKLLARALLDRNCVSQARLLLDARMDKIEKAELSVTDIQHFFEMEEMGLEVYVRLNKRTDGYDWMRLFRRLSDFLLTHRLRFLCAMKNESNFVRLDVEDFLVQKRNALRDVEQLGDNVHPLTQIYAHLLQLFTEEDYFVHFTAVQKWIRNHERLRFRPGRRTADLYGHGSPYFRSSADLCRQRRKNQTR